MAGGVPVGAAWRWPGAGPGGAGLAMRRPLVDGPTMAAAVPIDWIVGWLDVAGVAVFAASGALTASRQQMDVVGFALVATVTGIGGGTIRDLLLGTGPVFWVFAPSYLFLCVGVAILLFFAAPLFESRFRALLWADAAGLAIFCVIGAEAALRAGSPGSVAVLMGVITATFGGLVRDVLCAEVPLILRREIYATAAAVGARRLCRPGRGRCGTDRRHARRLCDRLRHPRRWPHPRAIASGLPQSAGPRRWRRRPRVSPARDLLDTLDRPGTTSGQAIAPATDMHRPRDRAPAGPDRRALRRRRGW